MVDYPRVHPETRSQWRAWLEANHAMSAGVWLVQWRTGTGRQQLTYDDVVEEALCFGWIDSRAKRLDDERSMITMTPRKAASAWSRSNKQRVRRLLAAGLMAPAGMRAVETAQINGAWELLDDVEALVVPDDLADALAVDEAAARGFSAMSPSARKTLLYGIKTAKRPETRARRVGEAVRLAAERAGEQT